MPRKTNAARWAALAKNPRDEYYTRYEDLSVLDEWDFSDMVVYSPFDSEKSAFVKYFKSHPVKEFIYTSDDYKNHRDLFEKADIVVTNPPFSEKRPLYRLCKETKTEMILVLPTIPCLSYDPRKFSFYPFSSVIHFDTPDGPKDVRCQFFSTIGSKKHPYGWSYEEVFKKPFPIGEPVSEFRGYPKHGKKLGFPPKDSTHSAEFVVTVDNNCSEFVPIENYGLLGVLVKYRSIL